MRIAIIDTGLDIQHQALRACGDIDGLTIEQVTGSDFFCISNGEFYDETGHGTAVTGIICEHIDNFNPFVVKLKGIKGQFTEDLLTEGLNQAINVPDVKLINISMGVVTESPSQRLIELVKKAHNLGIILVSSGYSSTNRPCYPAYFKSVFGVGKGYFMRSDDFQYIKNSKINILAKGTNQKVAALNNTYIQSGGTSYATAHFTAVLYQYFRGDYGQLDNLYVFLEKYSRKPIIEVPLNYTKSEQELSVETDNSERLSFYSSLDPEVEKIALFPAQHPDLNHLLENTEFYNRKISLAIDFPNVSEVKTKGMIKQICNIPNEEQMNLFDTVILCNVTDGYGLDDFKFSMLKAFIKGNKNIVTWDFASYSIIKQIISLQNESYLGKVYFPYYSENFITESHLNLSLPPNEDIPSVPIIEFGNTIDSSGYQFTLSRYLESVGYTVSNIVADPRFILYPNIDVFFPYATRRMVDLEWEKWGVFLRMTKRLIASRRKPDIFLTSIPPIISKKGIDTNSIRNTIFLKGVKPDSYIAVLNAKSTKKDFIRINNYIFQSFGIEPIFVVDNIGLYKNCQFTEIKNRKRAKIIHKHEDEKAINIIENYYTS